jgi:hypothetical protein
MQHLCGNRDGILEQFFCILAADGFHRLGHESAQSGCDLFNEQISC